MTLDIFSHLFKNSGIWLNPHHTVLVLELADSFVPSVFAVKVSDSESKVYFGCFYCQSVYLHRSLERLLYEMVVVRALVWVLFSFGIIVLLYFSIDRLLCVPSSFLFLLFMILHASGSWYATDGGSASLSSSYVFNEPKASGNFPLVFD